MILKKVLYLNKLEREITLEIYLPSNVSNTMDTIYFLDGQNTFFDKNATFGRSLRAKKHIDYARRVYNKDMLGVAIYNGMSERVRVNEYAPFLIDYNINNDYTKNKTSKFKAFIYDLKHTIIPYIEENYNVSKNKNNRFIYGSSLAATTSIYLAFSKERLFNTIAAFSTALFLFEDSFYKYLDERKNKNARIFLYVGKNELSDSIKDKNLYLNTSLKLYNYLKDKNIDTKLKILDDGIHNEASWDKAFRGFINFIYK